MKAALLGVMLALWPASAWAQTYDRYHELLDNTVKSPIFWVEANGAGVIDQANRFPVEWDRDRHPFVKRDVARIGQSFVSSIMEAGGAAAFHQRVGYESCSCAGFFRRAGHVVWRTFVQRKVDGGLALNVPFLAAKYGSAAVANAWYPDSYRTGDVAAQASFALGTAVGLNLIAEFSPDVLHAFHLH